MPRKTDSKNPADWLWLAESDLAVVRLASGQEVGFRKRMARPFAITEMLALRKPEPTMMKVSASHYMLMATLSARRNREGVPAAHGRSQTRPLQEGIRRAGRA